MNCDFVVRRFFLVGGNICSLLHTFSMTKYENRRSNRHNRYESRHFEVFIDEGEKDQIKKWVLKKDHIETGGDLFGLWIDQHTAVVQFVLGPGKGCRRTRTSFYQDVKYLEKAGKYLTEQHGLCNIGQWHSHHRIPLPRPSGGDENTVWGNMPNLGLNRYIVFIATLESVSESLKANLYCFLFETNERGGQYPVLEGKFKVLKGQNSSFRLNNLLLKEIEKGAERLNKTISFHKTKQDNSEKTRERMHVSTVNKTPRYISKLEIVPKRKPIVVAKIKEQVVRITIGTSQ